MFNAQHATPAAASSTVVVITTGTSWTPPAGVTNLKSVECWGPGGGGYLGGGGGGAYAAISNLACTPGTSIPLSIGTGGVGLSGPTPGNDGSGATWFKSTTTVKADYGRGCGLGVPATVAGYQGTPGKAANSVGTVVFDGGLGAFGDYTGSGVSGYQDSAGGGGGSASKNGAGGAGTCDYNQPSGPAQLGPGGSSPGGGAGGAGSLTVGGSDGVSNVEGGGGGGAPAYVDYTQYAGKGGAPGGGGAGGYADANDGGKGQIRITY